MKMRGELIVDLTHFLGEHPCTVRPTTVTQRCRRVQNKLLLSAVAPQSGDFIMLPEDILAELSSVTDVVPAAALHAAIEQRDVLTEPLLDALRSFVERTLDPLAIDDKQDTLPDMAMYLLAQFREPRAFALYETSCRLPEERSDYWLGMCCVRISPSFSPVLAMAIQHPCSLARRRHGRTRTALCARGSRQRGRSGPQTSLRRRSRSTNVMAIPF